VTNRLSGCLKALASAAIGKPSTKKKKLVRRGGLGLRCPSAKTQVTESAKARKANFPQKRIALVHSWYSAWFWRAFRPRKPPREKLTYLFRQWLYSAAHLVLKGLTAFLCPAAYLMWALDWLDAWACRRVLGREVDLPTLRDGIKLSAEW
jgi:hypothetical protein